MKLTKNQRLARLKPAVEIVEDELNRLPVNAEDDWERQDALMLSADMHNVIRHLKARWSELNKEHVAALTAQRDRLRRYAQAVEAYEATVGDFPDADLETLSDWLTERAAIRNAARQACLDAGDLEDEQ